MATLTVGQNGEFSTISSAVAASSSGDTIAVAAGTYTNDFVSIYHNLSLQSVGGTVTLVATEEPPNGKAIIDEGGGGVTVSISGFDISGAVVGDNNGAAIRYEGGTLDLTNDTIHDNQEGILSAADPNGVITIDGSTFSGNGAGDGYSHNIYVGAIQSLVVENSTITDAVVGHDIKSRAASNTIINNTVTDGASGTASYEIDLTNGGVAVVSGNVIEKGPGASNPIAITYGEEGNLYANGSLTVSGNTIVNDDTSSPSTTAVRNATGTVASITGNTFYGWVVAISGPANSSGNTTPGTEPVLSAPAPGGTDGSGGGDTSGSGGAGTTDPGSGDTSGSGGTGAGPGSGDTSGSGSTGTAPITPVTLGSGSSSIVVDVSEDAWMGDAQFTLAVDGTQIGGVQTASALHGLGQTQAFTLNGDFAAGAHTVTATFLNDAYGGTSSTDRNLYIDSITPGGSLSSVNAVLYSDGSQDFGVTLPAAAPPAAPPPTADPAPPADPAPIGAPPPTPTDNGGVVINLSEDAWMGDAQFILGVDGALVGGVQTVTALHGLGQTEAFTVDGPFAPGLHTFTPIFINDAYGGSDATDRNLYVDSITAGGSTIAVNAALFSNGGVNLGIILPGAST